MGQGRVIIVGAGPAGVRCAEVLVAAGIRPILVDEGRRDGGQIYRRQPEGFTRSYPTLYGTEAERARSLHQTFESLRGAARANGRAATTARPTSNGSRAMTARLRTACSECSGARSDGCVCLCASSRARRW